MARPRMEPIIGHLSILQATAVLLLATLGCHAVVDNTFQVGMVYSATGSLVDFWGEAVNGTKIWLQQQQDVLGANGFKISDGRGNTYTYKFNLTLADDQSDVGIHYQAVKQMIANGADFIFNAQPAFAVNESITVHSLSRVNIHGFTANDAVFTRDLSSVFGISQSNSKYWSDLYKECRSANIFSVIVAYRDDIAELKSACEQAIYQAGLELIKVSAVIKYYDSNSSTINNVANQINSTANAELLVSCMLSDEAMQLAQTIDVLKKPLKGMVFTNGPASAAWDAQLGQLSTYTMTPAPWFPSMKYSDAFFSTASNFASKYATLYGMDPTYVAAGTAAGGYVLQQALQAAFLNCDISATGGDVNALLYGNVLNCTDNQNNGRLRLIQTMSSLSTSTFFGDVTFNKYRQNYASDVVILQVFQTVQDLKQVLLPAVILPVSQSTVPKALPQPNRYAPVCQPGTYAGPDQFLPCILCPTGQFQDLVAQDHCEFCAKNYYQNTTGQQDCFACPDNSETAIRGATSISDCSCLAGFWTPQRVTGTACEPCPKHATCAGGVQLPQPNVGWFGEKRNPSKMFNCNPDFICNGGFSCAKGYRGRMCSYCEKGYFMAFTRCWECPGPVANMLAMASMYVLFFLINVSVSRSFDSFHIIMNFCQYLSIINAFNVNWPNALNLIMNYVSVLSFETDIIQPQCAIPSWSFEQNLYVQMAGPVAILAVVLVWTGFSYLFYRLKVKIRGGERSIQTSGSMLSSVTVSKGPKDKATGEKAVTKHDGTAGSGNNTLGNLSLTSSMQSELEASSWWLFLQNLVHIPSDRNEMKELLLSRLSIPLMFLNMGYLALLKYLLSAFYCFDFAGVGYIYYSPNDLCWSPKHYRLMMVASTGLVIYIGGVWFMALHVLRLLKRTRDFGGKRPLLLFGWLYERFQAEYHWYELIQMCQKSAYVVIMVFLLPDPALQVMLSLVVTVTAALMGIKNNAMIDSMASGMQTLADAALAILLMLGLVFFNDGVLTRTTGLSYYVGMAAMFGTLGILCCYLLVEIVMHILTEILMLRHKNIAKRWGHNVKKFAIMYKVFKPTFMVKWLFKAQPEDWQMWHRLCLLLHDSVHPTVDTSYLSLKKVGRFWRFLLQNFPEVLDFLVSSGEEARDDFLAFVEVMYEHFFDTQEELPCQLNMVISDRFKACVAQWLASAEENELNFVRDLMTDAYGHAQGETARRDISRAMSRAKSVASSRAASQAGTGNYPRGFSQPGNLGDLAAWPGMGPESDMSASMIQEMAGTTRGKNFAEEMRARAKSSNLDASTPATRNLVFHSKTNIPDSPVKPATFTIPALAPAQDGDEILDFAADNSSAAAMPHSEPALPSPRMMQRTSPFTPVPPSGPRPERMVGMTTQATESEPNKSVSSNQNDLDTEIEALILDANPSTAQVSLPPKPTEASLPMTQMAQADELLISLDLPNQASNNNDN